jgi:hypothetical protein
MPDDELSQRDKIDILKFIHQDQRGEMQHRREREHRIFTWSAGKLFASIYSLFCGIVFLAVASILVAPIAHRLLHRLHLDEPGE